MFGVMSMSMLVLLLLLSAMVGVESVFVATEAIVASATSRVLEPRRVGAGRHWLAAVAATCCGCCRSSCDASCAGWAVCHCTPRASTAMAAATMLLMSSWAPLPTCCSGSYE